MNNATVVNGKNPIIIKHANDKKCWIYRKKKEKKKVIIQCLDQITCLFQALKPQNTSEIPQLARNSIMAPGTAYQLLVLDYKTGTSGTDNRFKIASYSQANGQLNKRKLHITFKNVMKVPNLSCYVFFSIELQRMQSEKKKIQKDGTIGLVKKKRSNDGGQL